jgi:hypothetical protein
MVSGVTLDLKNLGVTLRGFYYVVMMVAAA